MELLCVAWPLRIRHVQTAISEVQDSIPIWLGEIGAWRGLTNVGLPILLIVILLVWFFKEFRLVWITGPNWAIIRLFGFNIWNGRLLGFMFRLEPVITVWKQSGSYTPIERLTDVVNLDTLAVTFIASGNVRPAENWHHRRIYARKIGLYAASDASTTTWVMAQTKIQIKTVIQAAAAGYRPERLRARPFHRRTGISSGRLPARLYRCPYQLGHDRKTNHPHERFWVNRPLLHPVLCSDHRGTRRGNESGCP